MTRSSLFVYRNYEVWPGNTVFGKYDFNHKEYTGTDDDNRCGSANSIEEAKADIDFLEGDDV